MKNKIIIITLILSLVFAFPYFSFAEDLVVEDNPVIENEQSGEKEEVKTDLKVNVIENENKVENTVKEEKENIKEETVVKEEKEEVKEITNPVEKVTVKLMARTGSGNYTVVQTWTAVKNGSNTWSNANRTANKYAPISQGLLKYSYTGNWKDEFGNTYTIGESKKGSDFISLFKNQEGPTATLEVYAQYDVSSIAKLNFNYNDNVGNGTGSWSNDGDFSSYTHTFAEPADYEKPQYSFLYWENSSDNEKKESGESKTIEAENLTGDTTIEYQATYEYQPAIRVLYHYEDGSIDKVGDSFEPVDIYKSASVKGLSWYYDKADETPISEGTKVALADTIVTTEKLDDVTIVNVYSKSEDDPVVPIIPNNLNNNPVTKTKHEQVNPIGYGLGDRELITSKQPTIIKKNSLPLSTTQQAYWALLNLIFALATCVLAFILIIFGILNKREEDEDTEIKNKWLARVVSVGIGILSLVIFFITENMNNPWIWVDNWTWLMAIIFIINVLIIIIAKHKEKVNEVE